MCKEQRKLILKEKKDGLSWNTDHVVLSASFGVDLAIVSQREEFECVSSDSWTFLSREKKECDDRIDDSDTLIADTFFLEDIYIVREVCFNRNDISDFRIRLIISNKGSREIKLKKLIPLLVKGAQNLLIGDRQAGEWAFYRQGRDKNNMPSVCILGRKDDAYKDALSGMNESGQGLDSIDENLPDVLVSDELTIIKGNSGNGPGSLLVGFLTGADQLVECTLETERVTNQFIKLSAACFMDGIILGPGQSRASEWIRLDAREDTFFAIEAYAKTKAKIYGARKSKTPPSVYSTWSYYGGTVTYEDISTNIKALTDNKIKADVFQIDGGWREDAGDWEPNHKFPMGMKVVAEEIKKAGFVPGIWTSPFLTGKKSKLTEEKPDWLLRKSNGEPVDFFTGKSDYYVLDITHPEVLKWFESLYQKLTHEWGYTYHKLDFTRAAINKSDYEYYDKSLTRAQAYRNAVKTIRRGMGEEAYVVMCGGLYDPIVGLVDAQRSGSDVVSMWDRPEDQKRGKMAPFTIKQNLLRYWMNELWDNDPDSLMVRRRKERFRELHLSLGLLNDEEVKVTALNQYLGGGIICFTEPMHEIEADRMGLLRHVIPSMGQTAIPRDMFLGNRFPEIIDMEVEPLAVSMGKWHTVAVVNWEDHPKDMSVLLDEELVGEYIEKDKKYSISEFWSGDIFKGVGYKEEITLGEIPAHSAVLLRIALEEDDIPMLLYANGHFSMGGREIVKWDYTGRSLEIRVNWDWDYPVEFIIQAPQGKKWISDMPYCFIDESKKEIVKVHLEKRYNGMVSLKLL